MRSPDRAAVRRGHCRAAAQGLSRTGDHPVRAAHRRAQGLVHGAREVGSRQGLSRIARRRRVAAHGEMAAARPLRRAQHRTARGLAQCERRQRSAIARRACERARSRPWCGSRAAHRGGRAKCRPPCSPPNAPARIAAPAFRNSTRACSRSIRGMAGAPAASGPVSHCRSSTASKAARRRSGATRTARRRRPVPSAAASGSTQSRGMCCSAGCRSRRSPICRYRNSPPPCASSSLRAASSRSPATCSRS